MKILKHGTLPEQQMFRGTCHNCKTEFECQRHEGKYFAGDQRNGSFLEVPCPVCGKKAFAYPRNDGSPVPMHRRSEYSMSGLAQQMADSQGWPGDH